MRKLSVAGLVAVVALSMGCNVKEHMEDIGLKEGKNVTEKVATKYDELIRLDQVCEQKWGDIDVTLQRRNDLIPNLVEVVKGYATHEQDTLRQVTEARASATQIKLSADDLSDPAKVEAFNKAQAQVKGSFGKLMLIQEKYPELKADRQFASLMAEMSGTENRIARARSEYNKSAGAYNTELLRVGGEAVNTIAGRHFKRREMFKADEAARTAPKVDFSKK